MAEQPYWALQYTQALNALLIQPSGPLFVALSSLSSGVRLTWAQFAGIAISLAGVLTIILRGDLGTLASIEFNKGDVMVAGAVLALGLYSALMPRRPVTHQIPATELKPREPCSGIRRPRCAACRTGYRARGRSRARRRPRYRWPRPP
jgi:EamA-like transporter family